MLSELLMSYVFDRLDKQIIRRIPYCLLFSLALYLFFHPGYLVFPVLGLLVVLFIVSTAFFNRSIDKSLEGILLNVDFKKFIKKIASIFEGGDSLLDDIKAAENWKIIILGVSSGLTFFLLLSFTFLLFIDYLNPAVLLLFGIAVVLVVFLFQDVAGANFLKENQGEKNESSWVGEVAERYTVSNSFTSFRFSALVKSALCFISRIVGPLCYLAVPKFGSETMLVYENPEVASLIKKLKQGDDKIRINHVTGQSIDVFFAEGHSEKITALQEKSPAEIFPYLLNPNFSYVDDQKKKWVALSLIERIKERENS